MPRLVVCLAMVVTLAIYWQTFSFGWVYEDQNWTAGLQAPHSELSWPIPGRSLTMQTFRWNYAVGELDPRGYHAGNVALFLLLGVSVFALGCRLMPEPNAAVAAIVTLWHPLNTQAVSYVSARTDLLVALCVVGASVALLGSSVWRWPLVALLAFGALVSKESGIVVFPMLAWLVTVTDRWSKRLMVVALMGSVAAAFGAMRLWIFAAHTSMDAWLDHAAVQATGFWRNVRLFVVPMGLSIDPDPWATSEVARVIALAAYAAAARCAWMWRQLAPIVALSFGWMVMAIGPRLLVVSPGEPLHEHQFLLASVALALLVGWLAPVPAQESVYA